MEQRGIRANRGQLEIAEHIAVDGDVLRGIEHAFQIALAVPISDDGCVVARRDC